MQIYQIKGGSLEEVENGSYNIEIGVSLGNKWFTPVRIVEQIEWALTHARENVVVCVADAIHAINIEVRNRVSRERALKLAVRGGQALLSEVRKEAAHIEKAVQEKILYAAWSDVVDEKYREKLAWLYAFYEQNRDFRGALHAFVKEHLSFESRSFSEADIHKLGTYLLEELPGTVSRVPIRGVVCEAWMYPFGGPFVDFIEDIQYGKLFPEVREAIMDTEPKVFLEVR